MPLALILVEGDGANTCSLLSQGQQVLWLTAIKVSRRRVVQALGYPEIPEQGACLKPKNLQQTVDRPCSATDVAPGLVCVLSIPACVVSSCVPSGAVSSDLLHTPCRCTATSTVVIAQGSSQVSLLCAKHKWDPNEWC